MLGYWHLRDEPTVKSSLLLREALVSMGVCGSSYADPHPFASHGLPVIDPSYSSKPLWADTRMRLTSYPGKGKGYVAAEVIPAGTLLLREIPIVGEPDWDEDPEVVCIRLSRDPVRMEALLKEVQCMAPVDSETPAEVAREARRNLAARLHGENPSNEMVRLYTVFKMNAFEWGLYPHAARMNHSCRPSCRFICIKNNGLLEVSSRRVIQQGEEITISYRTCQYGFPGLPWDTRLRRQQELRDEHFFECACVLCTNPSLYDLESLKCTTCVKGVIRPASGIACVQCDVCNGSVTLPDVNEVMRRIEALENAAGEEEEIDVCELHHSIQKALQAVESVYHERSLPVYRLRVLLVMVLNKSRRLFTLDSPQDAELATVILGNLDQIDRTAIHYATEQDLMRNPIIQMAKAVTSSRTLLEPP